MFLGYQKTCIYKIVDKYSSGLYKKGNRDRWQDWVCGINQTWLLSSSEAGLSSFLVSAFSTGKSLQSLGYPLLPVVPLLLFFHLFMLFCLKIHPFPLPFLAYFHSFRSGFSDSLPNLPLGSSFATPSVELTSWAPWQQTGRAGCLWAAPSRASAELSSLAVATPLPRLWYIFKERIRWVFERQKSKGQSEVSEAD